MRLAMLALLGVGLAVTVVPAEAQRATPQVSQTPNPQPVPQPQQQPQPLPQQPLPLPVPGQTPQNPAPQPGQVPTAPHAQGAMNAMFLCEAGGRFVVRTDVSGKLTVSDPQTQEQAQGTYAFDGQTFRFTIPAYNATQVSTSIDYQQGLLITFTLPNGYCYLIAHEVGPAVQGYGKCPKIGYIPGVGYQENAFELYQDRSVKWRQWDELTGIADTLYSEDFGVYLIEGDRFYMAFGAKEKERYLSGTIHPDGSFSVDQLEPDKGACKPS